MIHFAKTGIYADTEAEKLEFYDQIYRGDPVIWGHIQLWRMRQNTLGNKDNEAKGKLYRVKE